MTETIRLPSGIGVSPGFTGRGSKLEHPDILPLFWGPTWPHQGGDLGPFALTGQIKAMVAGAFFEGLKQYGYIGPSSVRDPMIVDDPAGVIGLPMPGPGVDQVAALSTVVVNFVKDLCDDDRIANVDDNHELIVLVFIDPLVAPPRRFDGAGNPIPGANGANTGIEIFEFLDDNIRFECCWVATGGRLAADVVRTASHELVEAITDPFGSGWFQSNPPPAAGQGQLTDLCNQNGLSGGVPVRAYWSVADNACIIPTPGRRRASIARVDTQHQAHPRPPRDARVDLGFLCGARVFTYTEVTYQNAATFTVNTEGYEDPAFTWLINGFPMSPGALTLPASWDTPPTSGLLAGALALRPPTAPLGIERLANNVYVFGMGPDAGNAQFRLDVIVRESFDTGDATGKFTSQRTAFMDVEFLNQELVWPPEYGEFKKHCHDLQHMVDTSGFQPGPPHPGDPADLHQRILDLVERVRVLQLTELANGLEPLRPEMAAKVRPLIGQG